MKTLYERARYDVGKIFSHPREIMASAELSTEQKISLLNQWEIDLRELLVASEENMTIPGATSEQTGELLRSVLSLRTSIEGEAGEQGERISKL
jgi:hypothetical protein